MSEEMGGAASYAEKEVAARKGSKWFETLGEAFCYSEIRRGGGARRK